jgi:hypothetical protein
MIARGRARHAATAGPVRGQQRVYGGRAPLSDPETEQVARVERATCYLSNITLLRRGIRVRTRSPLTIAAIKESRVRHWT